MGALPPNPRQRVFTLWTPHRLVAHRLVADRQVFQVFFVPLTPASHFRPSPSPPANATGGGTCGAL
jgi:hypothetical protein